MSEREELPVVSERDIARCLRIKFPCGLLTDRFKRMAMRVIVDAHAPSLRTGKVTPESAITNATAWIERAYREGQEDGARQADAQWRRKIMAMFGLEDAATGRKE